MEGESRKMDSRLRGNDGNLEEGANTMMCKQGERQTR